MAVYRYDGEGRRIARLIPKDENWDRTDYCHDESWQVVEQRVVADQEDPDAVATAVKFQYVCDQRHFDAPVLRDENKGPGAADDDCTDSGDERLYCTNDANVNVTALVDGATGNVVERYMYDAYGKVTILDGTTGGQTDWATDANQVSDVANDVLFAGYRFDAETGLYSVRNRMYHPTLGRWIQRDPAGYVDGENLYGYVSDNPASDLDQTCLCGETAPQPLGPWRGGSRMILLPYLYDRSRGWSDLIEPCGGPAPKAVCVGDAFDEWDRKYRPQGGGAKYPAASPAQFTSSVSHSRKPHAPLQTPSGCTWPNGYEGQSGPAGQRLGAYRGVCPSPFGAVAHQVLGRRRHEADISGCQSKR